MELVDTTGKPLQQSKTPQEVREKLKGIIPQNAEQRKILFKMITDRIEKNRRDKMLKGLDTGFNGTFADNVEARKKTDGFSDSRNYRLVARIPREMFFVAQETFGEDVIKDDNKFKQAFVDDEAGRNCLTVDPKKAI